ncbi:hypothetical protein EDD16DRAFT_1471698 [Pisolithus croceorrhizus]|nr:hypothetical protein EV401DRAFT_1857669 [Pisolithus croceorrhizus]KAI6128999.1 hypothetical protein EDD16DRAFT_1471698 [Pisolithus croceorrhizus]KAI6168076.1 hypothetical protein EDD17DRAFT_1466566 [Pisolithus thermaeus]
MVSENSIHIKPRSQLSQHDISLDSAGNSFLAQGLTQARNYAQGKPRFVEFACSDMEVFRYVLLITKIVIPKQFWGSKRNFNLVQRCEFSPCDLIYSTGPLVSSTPQTSRNSSL